MRDKKGRFIKGTNGWKGRKHSEKSRKKMSLTRKGKLTRRCSRCGVFISKNINHKCKPNPMLGRKRPEMIGNKLNWKGGTTKRCMLIRFSLQYKTWRSKVFERDNWTCQTCNKRGVYLEAHHIKELINIIKEYNIKTLEDSKKCKELWNLDNGVTLCKECHNLTKYGRPK